MTDRVQLAVDTYQGGCNCAQAVLTAFGDQTGLAEADALAMTACFGNGIGGMGEICGALTGALMALGKIKGFGKPGPGDRKRYNEEVKLLVGGFTKEHETFLCRDLLEQIKNLPPEERPAGKPCGRLVETAARLLEERCAAVEA